MAHSQSLQSGIYSCFAWSDGNGRHLDIKANSQSKAIYLRVDSYSPIRLTEAHTVKLYEALSHVYGPRPSEADVAKANVLTGELSDMLVRHRAGLSTIDRAILSEAAALIFKLTAPLPKG